jgi:hypothetical protein
MPARPGHHEYQAAIRLLNMETRLLKRGDCMLVRRYPNSLGSDREHNVEEI